MEDKEDPYITFWKEFGRSIKLGLIEDSSNRTKLSKLLRFKSTHTGEDGWTSLEDYIGRMKDWQKSIYYIAGENLDAVKDSMFLERFKQKDIEVLFMTEPIDEYALQNLSEYDNKKLQSITKENLKFGDEDETDKKREELYKDSFSPLTDFLKETYGDKVEKVTVSTRLASSPCVLVTGQYGYSANMERIMKAQAFADPSRSKYMVAKRIMEINPRHPIMAQLRPPLTPIPIPIPIPVVLTATATAQDERGVGGPPADALLAPVGDGSAGDAEPGLDDGSVEKLRARARSGAGSASSSARIAGTSDRRNASRRPSRSSARQPN